MVGLVASEWSEYNDFAASSSMLMEQVVLYRRKVSTGAGKSKWKSVLDVVFRTMQSTRGRALAAGVQIYYYDYYYTKWLWRSEALEGRSNDEQRVRDGVDRAQTWPGG